MEGAAMLQRIEAAPGDDAARAVYADWLQERGDPRGAFIAMQLTRGLRPSSAAEWRREFDLLVEHGTKWLDPIGQLLIAPVFERGFLAECAVTDAPTWAIDSRLWATVERLHLAAPDTVALAALVRSPQLRALELVSELGPTVMTELCRHPAPRPRRLRFLRSSPELLKLVLRPPPQVREVEFELPVQPTEVAALLRGPCAAQLERLEVSCNGARLSFTGDDGELNALTVSGFRRSDAEAVAETILKLPRMAQLTLAAGAGPSEALARLLGHRGTPPVLTPALAPRRTA